WDGRGREVAGRARNSRRADTGGSSMTSSLVLGALCLVRPWSLVLGPSWALRPWSRTRTLDERLGTDEVGKSLDEPETVDELIQEARRCPGPCGCVLGAWAGP